MKTEYHRLTSFVLGLAFALERVYQIVPESPSGLKAHLFSFKNKKAQEHFMNLMALVLRMDVPDNHLSFCVREYNREPLAERSLCWDDITASFDVHKKIESEESFDSSYIKGEFRRYAKEMYEKHQNGFDRVVRELYRTKPILGAEYDCGIIFIQQE